MIPVLVEDVYGMRDRSASQGVFLAGSRISTGIGPAIANVTHDILGSYTPIYYVASGVSLGLIVLLLLAVRGANRDRECARQELC